MLRNRFYYRFKPFLPWRLRIALRGIMARRKRRVFQDVWPIDEAAGQAPAGWPGWPDGKKFAFVLTHDVEGVDGVAKCRQLMQLERELGFRSSFNFIPEGDYRVAPELRQELERNGFEIGVHDLRHDGRLYWTRWDFSENARRINRYLKEWGACGFRSGFMLHNLDWLRELNVQYDASTFDTDPFEPQPDAVHTIFPFWVPRQGGGGYMELPYSLPQDSTLFLVLKETSPEIWKTKLDWIAGRGGMALVNVHPDYVGFKNSGLSRREFPSAHYRELLEHVRRQYPNDFWHALPREVAEYCSTFRPPMPNLSRRRICMVTHSFYQTDTRVISYADALTERGDEVDVIGLKRDSNLPETEMIGRVRVYRVLKRFKKNEKKKSGYLLSILKFWLAASARLIREHRRRPYDLIHVHNVPDFLVFAAWHPKLTGAKIILDIHDIVPEFYANKFHVESSSFVISLLKKIERLSAWFADHVIIANHLWHPKVVSRSVPEKKCTVFINHVNRKVFYPRERAAKNGKAIILFPGGLQWHQGLDIAIRAMPDVLAKVPEAEFHIYGDGNVKEDLVALTRSLALTEKVRFFDIVSAREIAKVMANADLGVVPKRADSFGNEAYSTKIMEFMSLGVPVVVSSTKIDRHYFDDTVVRFFESGNSAALAEAVVDVLRNDEGRRRMVARASEYAVRNSWDVRKADYLRLVDSLCASGQNRA